ncbi:putative RNA recognition motif domain, nucleotide-binding alpha-beta plait domain superfamily [Helianthus annuus]|nr:putative RNA recognition motif domain, nucleotide-binding alpha-beta plait domain superfamily [Helianthus annuus]
MGDGGQSIVKFFVSNLPDKWSSKEIGDFFSSFREVVGVYVARKRDKEGNRFGFMSFSGARNKSDLVESLKSVRMGNYKLRTNIARFSLENFADSRSKEYGPKEYGPRPCQGVGNSQLFGGQPRPTRPVAANPLGLAYRDILVGSSKNIMLEEKVVEVSSFVKPLDSWFGGDGFIQRLGGECEGMILVDGSLGGPNSFVRTYCLAKDLRSPDPLLDNEVLDSVGRLFGKVVHASSLSYDSSDLSYDLVGIFVGDGGRINDSVTLKWKDRKFVVWVHEETDDWVPDCIGNEEVREEGSETEPRDEDWVRPESPVATGVSPGQPLVDMDVGDRDSLNHQLLQKMMRRFSVQESVGIRVRLMCMFLAQISMIGFFPCTLGMRLIMEVS